MGRGEHVFAGSAKKNYANRPHLAHLFTDDPVTATETASESGEARPFPLWPALLFVATWLGGFWLIVGAALRPLLPGGWLAVGFGVVLGWVPIVMLVRGLSGGIYPSARIRLFVMRPFWYAMLFMPMLAAAVTLGAAIGLPLAASGSASRWALASACMLLASASLVGYTGSRRLVVKPLTMTLPRLPPAFEGLRVVQISDLHVGPQTSRRFLERVKQLVVQAEPDLIVITGDQVDDFWQDVELFVSAFGDLHARHGVFAIAGNHDIYAGWSGVHRGLVEGGIQVLVNDSVALDREGQRLWLAGTGDPAARGFPRDGAASAAPDIERTLREVPADEPVLALAHNPALWPQLAQRGVDLTLSGHTHYGQFAIPGLRWSLASPFLTLAMGSYRSGDSQLYINPGTNYWGIPLRIGTPPEVTALTLTNGRSGGVETESRRADR